MDDALLVRIVRRGSGKALIATQPIAQGAPILAFEGKTVAMPTQTSVQTDADTHVDVHEPGDDTAWQYLNHHCDPNAVIRNGVLVARADIAAGEQVTFDYETTELHMDVPFDCACGAAACRGRIRGFRHLSAEQQRGLAGRLADHLKSYLASALTLHGVFMQTVQRHPDACALRIPVGTGRAEPIEWTYAALASRAHALAAALPDVARDQIVALMIPRDHPDLYAGELATMGAGGAYLAIDPRLPDERVRFLLDDATPTAVLATRDGRDRLARLGVATTDVVVVDDVGAVGSSAPRAWGREGRADQLAYVIYTSGTTGRPKGVLIEHRSIVNLVQSDVRYFDLTTKDRVAQGSSHGYDSSVEEIWLAWGVGAALVVLDDETVRLGPDLVNWLRDEGITVFCPPPTLLRAMAVEDPAVTLTDVKLVYVGGEPLPRDIADAWAPGRALVNGYGPTECAVTTVRARVLKGEPVVIGHPVDGNDAFILDGALGLVADGVEGELVLRGVALARGYLNRPDLTAAAFPEHPALGRIYRTGDRAKRAAAGNLVHLGRLDAQVKVHGHRIELGAVETHLAALPGVRAAACRMQDGNLIAFVVPQSAHESLVFEDLRQQLLQGVPAHMVPSRFAHLSHLPTTTGGKLDRRALPLLDAESSVVGATRGEVEPLIARAIAEVLPGATVNRDDDFFVVLGGDSIAAARTISLLRKHERTASITVRDLYAARTVAVLAGRVEPADAPVSIRAPRGPVAGAAPLRATAVQTLWLLAGVVLAGPVLYVVLYWLLPWLLNDVGLAAALLGLPLAGLLGLALYAPLAVGFLALCKRVLIGRYTARRAPVWGHYYVRHWILTTLARVVPWRTLQGTGFASAALRVLGARVGKRVHIHRGVNLARGGWDLLDIGDDASIARDVSLRLVDLEDGSLVVGPIRIGRGAVVETRAGIDAGGVLGDGAHLSALSWVPRDTEIPAGQRWSGVPAQQADAVAPLDTPVDGSLSESAHGVASILSNFALGYGLYLFTIALPLLSVALFAGGDLLARLFGGPTDAAFFWGLLALVIGTGVVGLLCSALAVRLLPVVKPGVYSRWGWTWIHMNLKTNAVAAAGRVLSGTLFWPGWLRLAGMRIGAGSEVSTIDDVVPERVALGAGSFLADGIYLGSPDVRDGRVGVGSTSLGDETFVGNHVVVPTGVRLPNDVLIGVCTVASEQQIRSGSSWFGHPAFQLPRQRKAELSRALTHEPGVRRYLTRLFFETLRFALPVPPLAILLLMIWLVERVRPTVSTVEFMWGVLPLALLATGVSLCTLVLVLKWVLLGKVRPGTHGLWSFWCCRWDLLYVAWGAWCRGILAALEGTLWLPWYLRAMGMRIGKRAVLGGGFAQVVDPDMIEIGDDATVNALFQAHTFEDRVLKMDRVRIGDRATVGADAVLFYGAHVAADVRVMPNSVVMKHEHLSAGRTYAGCPTEVR